MNNKHPFTGNDNEKADITSTAFEGLTDKGFSLDAPEGYFETLPVRIMDRITSAQTAKNENPFQHLFSRPAYFVTVAAFVLFFLLLFVFLPERDRIPVSDAFPGITWGEAMFSDPMMLRNTDENSLFEIFLDTGETESSEVSLSFSDCNIWIVSEEAIMEYLSEDSFINECIYEF